jgi:DNA-binding PadR family transcriptional regulator
MSLKHSILAILSSEPKTGYQLSKDVEGSIRFFWQATHQQVYRDLADLERSGFVKHKEVTQEEKPDKKVYSITKAGTKELIRWMKEPSEIPATRDSFMIKLFMGHLVGAESLLKDLRNQKQIHENRQNLYRQIEKKYAHPFESLSADQQYMYMTLRRGILLEQAWLAWCQEVEDFLAD